MGSHWVSDVIERLETWISRTRSQGRPRIASGALVDAAVQWLGSVGKDTGLGSIVAFFDNMEDPNASNQAKRRKVEQASQARLRHILLKHKECKSVVDKV